MSACAIKHWGTGTPCIREPSTPAAKETAAALAAMRAEREKQDTMWSKPAEQPKKPQAK